MPSHAAATETNSTWFRFLAPTPTRYRVARSSGGISAASPAQWAKAWPGESDANPVELGSRVVLELSDPKELAAAIAGLPLELSRTVGPDVFILQAPDAAAGLRAAEALSARPGVVSCHPVIRRPVARHGLYAAMPNDPYFPQQWHLENRNDQGEPAGLDLNVRAAWPWTMGENTLIAVADCGADLGHPDLRLSAQGGPHFNFFTQFENGAPYGTHADHGTAVAGLALAQAGNRVGVCGVAPKARLASWVVLSANTDLSDEVYMDMYQYRSNAVSVQNHSWGYTNLSQIPLSLLERTGLSNAVLRGRDGKGVILVRAGGNDRGNARDMNDEELSNDPFFIAVGAAREDGRVASYSQRGACVLVAAPGGDGGAELRTLVTTDRRGADGYNTETTAPGSADYTLGETGFEGTSAAAPLIAGTCALILSANPSLHYRDVQQILALSARHLNLGDPNLRTNGAGLRVSHDLGFGVPDAGEAVRLARLWKSRPERTEWKGSSTEVRDIPERPPLRLSATWTGFDASLATPNAMASLGPQAPASGPVPMVYIGRADTDLSVDLTDKCALIQRGNNFFYEKIDRAAQLGAKFAVVFNNRDFTELLVMALTEVTPIPAVFIGQNDGELLRARIAASNDLSASLNLESDNQGAMWRFDVPATLLCEHVAVRVRASHPRRGDLQITLLSPAGTRSVLQAKNFDANPGPSDWTYFSTQHFFESSAGVWTVSIVDQRAGQNGQVLQVELTVTGVAITDTDRDGLDDDWERANFGTLDHGPKEDPDLDGYSNIREYLAGTDPTKADIQFELNLSPWNTNMARLSWPGREGQSYEVLRAPLAAGPYAVITNIAGRFPETEWLVPSAISAREFYQVREAARP